MVIDFRKSNALSDPIIINDHTVERVYQYLGVMLNSDLSWSNNTDYIISLFFNYFVILISMLFVSNM